MAGISTTLSPTDLETMAGDIGNELIAFMNPEDILRAMTPEKHETILKFLLKMYDTAGSGVEVLLNMAKYRQLSQNLNSDSDFLIGLSEAELGALAASKLVPSTQTRLNELLRKNTESQLSSNEDEELDNLLEHVDQLTILKTRAGYTLHQYRKSIQALLSKSPYTLHPLEPARQSYS